MNRLKQILKKIDFLQVIRVVALSLGLLLPVASSAAGLLNNVPCGDLNGVSCSSNTVSGLIKLVINWMLALAGLIAVLFLIIGGFWYITSAGNEEQAEKGKGTVINAIIGIIIIVLSWVIVNVVSNLVASQNSSGI